MPGGILLNPSASEADDCCCGGGKCSTYYCQACGVYLLIDQGSVTDDSGSYSFDLTGTTASAPDGHWYVLDCTSHAPKVALEEHWINDDGDEQVEGSIATPSSCDPLSSSHSYLSTGVPATSATVSVPRATGLTCEPCCVPGEADGPLSLTLSGGALGNGTYTMGFTSAGWGVTFSAEPGLSYTISFGCLPGGQLRITTASSAFGSVDCTISHIADFSCNPYHIHFTDDPTVCVTPLFNDFVVDGP